MYELAKALSLSENFNEAITLNETALLTFERKLGPHKSTANVLECLGELYLSVSKFDESYRYLERALVLKRLLYGNENEAVSDTLYLIGKVQGKSGEMDDALDSLKEGKK